MSDVQLNLEEGFEYEDNNDEVFPSESDYNLGADAAFQHAETQVIDLLGDAWEAGRAAAQKMWVTVTEWGGSVPDGLVEQMNPYRGVQIDE